MARKNICSASYLALVSVISIKLPELETSKTLQPFEITKALNCHSAAGEDERTVAINCSLALYAERELRADTSSRKNINLQTAQVQISLLNKKRLKVKLPLAFFAERVKRKTTWKNNQTVQVKTSAAHS